MNAQILNQTSKQPNANFNISGNGIAQMFRAEKSTDESGAVHFGIYSGPDQLRWGLGMLNTEAAGNQGGNFTIFGYGNSNEYLGAYLSILRRDGRIGLGWGNPQAKLHMNLDANGNMPAMRIGRPGDAGNINVPQYAATGGYDIDFYTWRDMTPDQIGARIRAERINIYANNNAQVQGMDLVFSTSDGWVSTSIKEKMRIRYNGEVGIGTTDTKGYKLAVAGSMIAERVKVKQYVNWPDFVFHQDYQLPSLATVENYIKENQHLPEIPSAADVAKNGIDVGEMNEKLLKKIEELTLYLIDLKHSNDALKQDNEQLKHQMEQVKVQLSGLKSPQQ
ncbi:MAG TPA: hypothetical protein VM802_27310 [Chitinophaga sp.]|nr:hypothetical protein [Chitinophaga sp.]